MLNKEQILSAVKAGRKSHDYSSGKFTALLNIYHLLKGNEVCTYHKYKLGGVCLWG